MGLADGMRNGWRSWMDPAPGRTTTWLTTKAPELMCLGGAVGFGVFGVAVLLSNPAGNSTSGDNYGPDAPLQPWVLFIGGACLVMSGLCLLMTLALLWKRWSRRTRATTSQATDITVDTTLRGSSVPHGEDEDDVLRP